MKNFLTFVPRALRYGGVIVAGCLVLSTGVQAADRAVTLPTGAIGTPYSYRFLSESGFAEPYIWQISTSTLADVLPPGLSASRSGAREILITGAPTQVGRYQFTIAPFSSDGAALPTTLATLEVRTGRVLPTVVAGTGSRVGMLGMAFSSEPILRVEGGEGPYAWRLVSGGLPLGLRFTSRGSIEGSAGIAGTYVFQAEVSDALGFRSTTSVKVMVQQGTSVSSGAMTDTSSPRSSSGVPVSHLSYSDRWNVLNRLGVSADTVIRTDYLDPLMLRPLHYYIGTDGRRHVFQSDAVYYSWYPSIVSQSPRVMSMQDIASIPLGEPITHHPGERVRFRTDMSTYSVGSEKSLWRLPPDYAATPGWGWERGVEELDETHFTVYQLMDGIAGSLSTYNPAAIRSQYVTPNSVLSASVN